MCYERADIIRTALAALLKSDGLGEIDVFISQDGGSNYTMEVPDAPGINLHYIRHPVNLCPGQHHHLVKWFVFEVMKYDYLMVVEEDNVLHPDALKVLRGLLVSTVNEREIGLVVVNDCDNSVLVDASRFDAAAVRWNIDKGHLWVFGLHRSRFEAVYGDLLEYLLIIVGQDYSQVDQPPLQPEIVRLHERKGFPAGTKLSQDAFFVHSLARAGYTSRAATLLRLFEPIGWQGLHFRESAESFFNQFGRGMYSARVKNEPREVGRTKEEMEVLVSECHKRLDVLYREILGRDADTKARDILTERFLTGKLNAVEVVHRMRNGAEAKRRMEQQKRIARLQSSL
ncbi:hypothetical protein GPECTOR_3g512 [Gonium pectorale]|uniref:Uncharacterized protein n=1 Tax=Gonium pectorale TaxID=33097 RepID=A0A150GZP4_GONPE|nr:hypothetical protein GPECTOR_3g512 [Gonium pectorale]|eukprot:KXZ55386.1 hypothetical protein GPECTOR_3g512 [Gonium pectorale]